MDKLIGYAYFGRSRGLQTVNGGDLPPSYPVNDIIDLTPSMFQILPGTRLLRVKRDFQEGSYLQFISIYYHAKEKEGNRRGTFFGATLALQNCLVDASQIYSFLNGMINYLKKELDEEKRFKVYQLASLKLEEPEDFDALISAVKKPIVENSILSSKEGLIHLNKRDNYSDSVAFIHQALSEPKYYVYNELFATPNLDIIVDKDSISLVEMDLYYQSTIDQKELEAASLDSILSQKEKAKEELNDTIKLMEENSSELNGKIDNLNTIFSDLSNQFNLKKSSLEGLPEDIDALRINKQTIEKEIEESTKIRDELELEITKNQQKNEKLEKDIVPLNDEITQLTNKKNELQSSVKKEKTTLSKTKEKIGNLDKEFAAKNKELIALNHQLKESQGMVSSIDEEKSKNEKEIITNEEVSNIDIGLTLFSRLKKTVKLRMTSLKKKRKSSKFFNLTVLITILFFSFKVMQKTNLFEKGIAFLAQFEGEPHRAQGEAAAAAQREAAAAAQREAAAAAQREAAAAAQREAAAAQREADDDAQREADDDAKIQEIESYAKGVKKENYKYDHVFGEYIRWMQEEKMDKPEHPKNNFYKKIWKVYNNWCESGFAKFMFLEEEKIEKSKSRDGIFNIVDRIFIDNELENTRAEKEKYQNFLKVLNPDNFNSDGGVKDTGLLFIYYIPMDDFKSKQ